MRNRHKVCRYFVGNYNTARSLLISPLRYTRKLLLKKHYLGSLKTLEQEKVTYRKYWKYQCRFTFFTKTLSVRDSELSKIVFLQITKTLVQSRRLVWLVAVQVQMFLTSEISSFEWIPNTEISSIVHQISKYRRSLLPMKTLVIAEFMYIVIHILLSFDKRERLVKKMWALIETEPPNHHPSSEESWELYLTVHLYFKQDSPFLWILLEERTQNPKKQKNSSPLPKNQVATQQHSKLNIQYLKLQLWKES